MINEPPDARGDGFFDALRNSAATKRLWDETRGTVYAHATRTVGKVGESISDTTDRLTKAGEKTGQRPTSAKGDSRLNPGAVAEKTGSLWRAAGRRARVELNNLRRMVTTHDKAPGESRGERAGPVTKSSDPARPARATGKPAQAPRTGKDQGSGATKAQSSPAAKKAQPARATKAQSSPAAKKPQPARASKAQPSPPIKKNQNGRISKTHSAPAAKGQSPPAIRAQNSRVLNPRSPGAAKKAQPTRAATARSDG